MLIITIIRLLITLTFLILAFGGTLAFFQLRAFIKFYTKKHAELVERVIHLEGQVRLLEARRHGTE